jgi:hypothetical protein
MVKYQSVAERFILFRIARTTIPPSKVKEVGALENPVRAIGTSMKTRLPVEVIG